MNLKAQDRCEKLVRQHHDALVQVRRDIVAAVETVARIWEPFFPDPSKIHGQQFCTDVRGVLHLIRSAREEAAAKKTPPGVLTTHCGQGMSVMLVNAKGVDVARVRKTPSEMVADHERLVVYPTKAQREAAQKALAGAPAPIVAEQLTLGDEFDQLDPNPDLLEWFVLWTLSQDALQVPEVFLAAVIGIDDSTKTVVLASTPLPREVESQQDDGDFEEYRKPGEEAGPSSS